MDKMQKSCSNGKWYAPYEGVCCNGDSSYRGEFQPNTFVCDHNKPNLLYGNYEVRDVTHWMPLPEAPEGVEA